MRVHWWWLAPGAIGLVWRWRPGGNHTADFAGRRRKQAGGELGEKGSVAFTRFGAPSSWMDVVVGTGVGERRLSEKTSENVGRWPRDDFSSTGGRCTGIDDERVARTAVGVAVDGAMIEVSVAGYRCRGGHRPCRPGIAPGATLVRLRAPTTTVPLRSDTKCGLHRG